MSAPPYQPGTPAPSAHHDPDPDPTRHLNAPPYPLDQQPGRPTLKSNATDHQNTQQHTANVHELSDNQGFNQLAGSHCSSAYPKQNHSTYDSSAQGYHAQGQVTNSLNIDPALLALEQGARSQPAFHLFNMHGANVTFAAHSFQHNFGANAFQQSSITQGNQNLRQEGTEPSINNADEMNVDAHMFDEYTRGIVDDDSPSKAYDSAPAVPAYGLNTFDNKLNNFRDLMPPPPLPLKALAQNAGNNIYQVYAQLGGAHTSASPDVFSPELMNSGDDHSVGGTNAMQESSGDPRPGASPIKKRGRSSSDDSRSSVSIDGIHELHRPMAQRKRTRTSQSSATRSSSESQASISMSRRESLLAADYSDIKVASRPLKGMSRHEATMKHMKRVALDISGKDNVEQVKGERVKWLHAIMQAFDAPFNSAPKTKNIDLAEFRRWQKEHHALTMEQFEQDSTNDLAEAIATHLFNQVVDGHTNGALIESSGKSFKHDDRLNCRDRLEKIVEVLTGLTIIRLDLATGARVNELVANPDAVFKRKEENKLENDKKRVRSEVAKAMAKNKESAVKAKNSTAQTDNMAKGGKQRGSQSESAVIEESSSGSDDHSSAEELVSSARNVFTSVPEPKPVNNAQVNNDEESSSGSDDHLSSD